MMISRTAWAGLLALAGGLVSTGTAEACAMSKQSMVQGQTMPLQSYGGRMAIPTANMGSMAMYRISAPMVQAPMVPYPVMQPYPVAQSYPTTFTASTSPSYGSSAGDSSLGSSSSSPSASPTPTRTVRRSAWQSSSVSRTERQAPPALVAGADVDKDELATMKTALLSKDEQVRRKAAEYLAEMGPAAIPALTDAMRRGSKDVRLLAIETLESMGSKAKGATLALTLSLKDSDDDIRAAVQKALETLRPSKG